MTIPIYWVGISNLATSLLAVFGRTYSRRKLDEENIHAL